MEHAISLMIALLVRVYTSRSRVESESTEEQ